MSNGLFAGATFRGPVPNKNANDMSTIHGVVLHIMQGTLAGTDSWFKNPASQVSAHFGVGKDGTIYQWVNTKDKAWAEVSGNAYWISVENEGTSGQSLTDAQVASNAKIYAWVHKEYGIKLQKANEPAGEGLGYHAMGGADWGDHLQCPGVPIIGQRQRILDEAAKLLNVKPKPPVPPVIPVPPVPTEPAWFTRTLSVRTPMLHGLDVEKVQRVVKAKEDGWYGEATAAKVRGWQKTHKLTVDGVVGPATARAIG